MSEPLDRPQSLDGRDLQAEMARERACDLHHGERSSCVNGHRRPFEVFINSKNMEHFAWTVALTRMISAVFRRGGDVSFVVEELKAVFDPRGVVRGLAGAMCPRSSRRSAAVIERHMIETGFHRRRGDGAEIGSAGASGQPWPTRGPGLPVAAGSSRCGWSKAV
jgi:ribonucleoside-diphosphate reductase alpha chain